MAVTDLDKGPHTYSKTRTPNLVRYDRTKEYYLLYKLNGKQVRTPLKTSDYKVAVRRRNAKMLEVEKLRSVAPKKSVSVETFGSLFDEYKKKTRLDQDISCSTKEGRVYAIKRIVKTLPGIEGKKPMNLEIGEVVDWIRRLKTDGTNFVAPGAKSGRKGNSAYTVNRTISVLSVILDKAVAKGLAAENIIRTNQKLEKLKVRGESKKIHVPSKSDLTAIVEHLKGYWAGHYSFSIQLIAYSGCRVGEARALKWCHVNFEENKLEIAGSKTDSSNRIIHMSQSLREVLEAKAKQVEKAFSQDTDGYLNERIMPIDCCNKQLTRACSELGIPRITNHDLRHYFGTSCLEADIPVSTVAAWMGHSDGGALLLKTYAHLRDQHSAKKAATLEL